MLVEVSYLLHVDVSSDKFAVFVTCKVLHQFRVAEVGKSKASCSLAETAGQWPATGCERAACLRAKSMFTGLGLIFFF